MLILVRVRTPKRYRRSGRKFYGPNLCAIFSIVDGTGRVPLLVQNFAQATPAAVRLILFGCYPSLNYS